MKVKELLNIFSRAEKVLKLYENKTVDEMIDDVYLKLCNKNVKDNPLERANNKKNKASNIITEENSYKKIIDKIKYKEKQEIIKYMQKFKKDDLMEIGKLLEIKINKSSRKDIIIEGIASYFSFINLKQKVSEREDEELEKFINSNI